MVQIVRLLVCRAAQVDIRLLQGMSVCLVLREVQTRTLEQRRAPCARQALGAVLTHYSALSAPPTHLPLGSTHPSARCVQLGLVPCLERRLALFVPLGPIRLAQDLGALCARSGLTSPLGALPARVFHAAPGFFAAQAAQRKQNSAL